MQLLYSYGCIDSDITINSNVKISISNVYSHAEYNSISDWK